MNASFTTTDQHHSVALDRIAALGTIVTVWAHPDDETYVAGGLMAIARHLGQSRHLCDRNRRRLRFRPTPSGDAGRGPAPRRARSRARPARRDGPRPLRSARRRLRRRSTTRPASALVADVLDSRRPDTVITFGPDGLTGHPDHRAVSRWTSLAVRSVCPDARLLCPTLTPDMADADRDINDRFDVYAPGLPATHEPSELALDLTLQGAWLDLKIAALHAHASQTAALIEAIGATRYRRWVEREPLIDLENYRSSG